MRSRKKISGFALVELLVVLAVFGVIVTLTILAYGRIKTRLAVSAVAYEVALSVREAQNYGVSVKEFRSGGRNTFEASYGVFFSENEKRNFVLFADAKPDSEGGTLYSYDGSNTDFGCLSSESTVSECVSMYLIDKADVRIEKFCGVLPSDNDYDILDEDDSLKREECSPVEENEAGLEHMTISFKRPNPDAQIRTDLNEGVAESSRYKSARIYIVGGEARRAIQVMSTGQISVI